MTEDTRQETIERGTDEAQRADFDGQEEQTPQAGDIFDSSLERIDWALDTVRKNKEKVPDDRSKSVLETAEERLLKARERLINTREKVKPFIPEEEKEEASKALEILERGPANHNEIIEMVHGLSYEERRQQELIAKYGKSCLARCKAFFAGELDSHLLSGVNAKQDLAEKNKWGLGSLGRAMVIGIFNRKNIPATGVALAVGLLTGGIGAPAVGVIMGGSAGRAIGELWGGKGEKSARGDLMALEREHWLRLKELAASFRGESDEETKKIRLKTFIDEFSLADENGVNVLNFKKANEDLQTAMRRGDKIKSLMQSAGGVAGLGGGLLYGIHMAHGFSGIDMDLWNKIDGQSIFHNVKEVNGVWNFQGHVGERIGGEIIKGQWVNYHDVLPKEIYYHFVDAAHNGAAEVAYKIYAAAAAKALPTLGALCLTGLRSKKGRLNHYSPENYFTYYNRKWGENRGRYQAQSAPESRTQEPISREEGIAAAREKIAKADKTPEGEMTREQTLDDSKDNDFRLSRRAAMIILARLQSYAELIGKDKTEAEGMELFKQKAKEILSKEKEITVHCTDRNPKRSDLDGEIAIKLIELALGHRIKVNLKPQGEFNENNINIDTGMKDAYHATRGDGNDLFSGTVFIDHHGLESKSDTSAAKLVYQALVSYGLLEKSDRLDKLVEFVTHFDNMTGKYKDDKAYERSPYTVLGLHGAMGAYKLFNFFLKNKNPDYLRDLTEEELKSFGLKGKRKDKEGKLVDVNKPKDLEDKRKEALDLLGKLPIIDTSCGKVVVDKEGRLPKEAFASSKYDIHIKGFKSGGFLISNVPLNIYFKDGQRIRNMWICKDKPENGTTIESIINTLKAAKLMPKAA